MDAAIDRLIKQLNPSVIDIRIIGYSLGAAVAICVAEHLAQSMIRQARARKEGIFTSPLLEVRSVSSLQDHGGMQLFSSLYRSLKV